ncbi:uncharacterized protein LOC130514529 isoform X2 [Takifugu flavidus]|uniref:uncharacterized protein LOC130514529 isoform X2 n=1 Tax=Takifugu flavidus TaxID=433684 RepID=UPI0025445160|nr:uncharacterized protein LOC130514529 isoform X2 [Takifugu flavidus]
MAVNETKIFLESFLQKRKDTMRVRWATYWFRLQNATLFFYTKMNGNALNLRGNYYICTVQSVREVHKAGSKRFMFEINMKNGKRKLLAAESAELRQRWVGHLWQAMHLSASWASTFRSTHQEVYQQQTEESNGTESLPSRPLSAPADNTPYEIRSLPSPTSLPQAHICRTIPPASATVSAEDHYDVLPIRKGRELRAEMESLYDVPSSNMSAPAHPGDTENIYDVPSALLRKIPDYTSAQRTVPRKPSGGYEAWKDGGLPEAKLHPMP